MANVNFKGFKLNLTALFIQEAKNLISAYKSLLTRKIGTRGDQAPPNKPSTVKRKGKSHWMVDTGNTKNKGFLSDPQKTSLTIFASQQRHRNRDISYEKLFLLHNTARGRYSGVFGQAPVGSKIFERMDKEINRQVQRFIEKRLPKRIIVKVKR
jgi:hypothetical protein